MNPQFSEGNDAQRRFWSDGPGLNWVALKDDLDQLHAPMTEALIAAAAPQPGERIIDIGCGAGATTLMLARAAGPTGKVTGIDLSDSLLAAARDRAARMGDGAPEFVLADAQVWQPDAPADLCTSRMGVMFFADPVAAFANIAAMLRPGGRLVFICWRDLAENPWFHLPLGVAIDHLGPAAPGDPDGPGPMALRDPARIHDLLARAGFEEVRVTQTDTHVSVPGGHAAAADLALRIGPATRHMRDHDATAEDAAVIHAALLRALAPFNTPRGAEVPARMNLVTARRP